LLISRSFWGKERNNIYIYIYKTKTLPDHTTYVYSKFYPDLTLRMGNNGLFHMQLKILCTQVKEIQRNKKLQIRWPKSQRYLYILYIYIYTHTHTYLSLHQTKTSYHKAITMRTRILFRLIFAFLFIYGTVIFLLLVNDIYICVFLSID